MRQKGYRFISKLTNHDYLFKKMILSFITPIYNEEKYLPFLFQNIDRDYEKFDFEWIFIDDGSTDKSVELIEKFQIIKKDKVC